MGDGRAEGLSATGHGGQAAVSLMPDVDGTDSGELNSTHPFLKISAFLFLANSKSRKHNTVLCLTPSVL